MVLWPLLILLFSSFVYSETEENNPQAEIHTHSQDDSAFKLDHHGDASQLDPQSRQILADNLPEELARRLGLRQEAEEEVPETEEMDVSEEAQTEVDDQDEVYDKRPLLGLAMALRINDIPFVENALASILPFVDTYTIILEEKEITPKAKRFSERQKRNTFSEEEKKDDDEAAQETDEEEEEEENSEGEVETEESILEQNTRAKQRVQEILNEYFKVQKNFDTGATILEERGNQKYIQKPGELLQLPFVDFSTSKNQALEGLGLKTIFAIVLQPEEVFTGDGMKLRHFCEDNIYSDGVDHEVYLLPYQHSNRTQYYLERLIRTGYGWFYFGSTYEALIKSGSYAKIRAPEYLSIAFRALMTTEQQKERWELNKKLLEKDYSADQNNTRTLFYLAQTYANLNEWGKAFVFYDKRARAGGWKEEVYDALYSKAYSAGQVKRPWHEVQHYYLHAFFTK